MKTDGGLRGIFRTHLPAFHWCSIESSISEPGVPDMNGCFKGVEFWIENKVTAGMAVRLRPDQIGWLLRRSIAGGKVFVAVRRKCEAGKRRIACDELYLIRGKEADTLAEKGLGVTLYIGRWEGGPARWNWLEIAETLIKSHL